MDGTKNITTDFTLFGLGDGEKLFSDYETEAPASVPNNAFTTAANPSVRKDLYWQAPDKAPDADVMNNFRAMIFDRNI